MPPRSQSPCPFVSVWCYPQSEPPGLVFGVQRPRLCCSQQEGARRRWRVTSAEGGVVAPLCPHVREVTAAWAPCQHELVSGLLSRTPPAPDVRADRGPSHPPPGVKHGLSAVASEASRSWEPYGRSHWGEGNPRDRPSLPERLTSATKPAVRGGVSQEVHASLQEWPRCWQAV